MKLHVISDGTRQGTRFLDENGAPSRLVKSFEDRAEVKRHLFTEEKMGETIYIIDVYFHSPSREPLHIEFSESDLPFNGTYDIDV